MILGIDSGNSNGKICGPFGVSQFTTTLGEYRERKFDSTFGEDDMIVEYEGRKWFAGTLAKFESRLGGSRKGGSKAHNDAKLRTLIAIHRYADDNVYDIVVGQPIGHHKKDEKEKIQKMLIGRHEITINGITKKFLIRNVLVAAEGATAALSSPQPGLMRIIDIGSGTINFATLNNMRYVDLESFTTNFGMESSKIGSLEEISRSITNEALDNIWSTHDQVFLVGGGADILLPHLREEFKNCELLRPKVKVANGMRQEKTIFANAIGFYNVAVKKYG